MCCESLANALQAIGTLIEFAGLVGIIWNPVFRPALQKVVARARKLWPFGERRVTVGLDLAAAYGIDPSEVVEHRYGPEDEPDAPLEQRLGLLLRRAENIESRLGDTESRVGGFGKRVAEVANKSAEGNSALSAELKSLRRDSIQVRVQDASIFAVGVGVTAVGALLAAVC